MITHTHTHTHTRARARARIHTKFENIINELVCPHISLEGLCHLWLQTLVFVAENPFANWRVLPFTKSDMNGE